MSTSPRVGRDVGVRLPGPITPQAIDRYLTNRERDKSSAIERKRAADDLADLEAARLDDLRRDGIRVPVVTEAA